MVYVLTQGTQPDEQMSFSDMSWHQQRAWTRAAARIISGRDVPHGYRDCDCCGLSGIGPLDDGPYKCDGCENDDCNPADTYHCFTGNCDGSGCGYHGACHLRWNFEPEFTYESEDRPGLKFEVALMGGGTVGKAYAYNGWWFRVLRDGTPFYAGDGLTSGAWPLTHQEITENLVDGMEASGLIPERG